MPLAIDATGLHPTTDMCLKTLQWLEERRDFSNILEIGCGNGILSLAAASVWRAPVLAVDISEKAVADTQGQIAACGLSELVTALRGDGFNDPRIHARAPYDLIICNLLAETLVRLAPDIKSHLAPGGYALLSGSLAWLAGGVEETCLGLGFEIVHKTGVSPWQSWVLCHNGVTKA